MSNFVLLPVHEHFNYLLSLTRGQIEKCFGMLKTRFRWALRGTPMSSDEVYADHFLASCVLHNIILGMSFAALTT
jgi:hypothetical protein